MLNTSFNMGLSPQSFVPLPCIVLRNYAPITDVTGHGRTLVLDAALLGKNHSALGHIGK